MGLDIERHLERLRVDGSNTASTRAPEYPPDAYFKRVIGVSFTWLFVALAVVATIGDYLLFGNPDTGIPYNYPLPAGLLYIIAVLFILRRFYATFISAKEELLSIIDRSSADNVVFDRDSDVTPEQINEEVNAVMSVAFSPITILVGGFVGGVFSLGVMWAADVFQYFPYMMMNYAYGAGHGFFYGPILGSVYMIYKLSTEYIVDIDILDPDGVGGYGDIGTAIINLIIYGIFLVTLDFVILSSVTFVDEPVFQTLVFVLYVVMIAFLLGITVLGILSIRRRLLAIRERKTEMMRDEFKSIEERYWRKLEDNVSPQPESAHIDTMETMYNRLHSMELWPINLASLSRLLLSAGSSGAIALYKAGFIGAPL